MQFYRIIAKLDEKSSAAEVKDVRTLNEFSEDYAEHSDFFYQKSRGKHFFFVQGNRKKNILFGGITYSTEPIEKSFSEFLQGLPFAVREPEYEECTFDVMDSMLGAADRRGYISSREKLLDEVNLTEISGYRGHINFGESLLRTTLTKEELLSASKEMLLNESLTPELERIYEGSKGKAVQGHPVHYFVRTDNRDIRRNAYKTLLEGLYNNGRIKSRRYCFLNYDDFSTRPDNALDVLYSSCENAAVVIRYEGSPEDGGRFSRGGDAVVERLCELALKYRKTVLTVFCIPEKYDKDNFLVNLEGTSFIEIRQNSVDRDSAVEYLKDKAKNNKIRYDRELNTALDLSEEDCFNAMELDRIFDNWYDAKLRSKVYPQYKNEKTVKKDILEKKPESDAYSQLRELVGLTEAKRVMDQALNYFKVQKLFSDRGISGDTPSMHMVFTGNPGSAKTTVARLFARIMKETGMLENGDLYEVGRADLVGKYVGYTAPLVKKAFSKAKGGVLFIDEAYSLVDGKDGLYGDEAINTIVQEMENNRKDTVVIFAGYPDKMEAFLNKNPGLRSRIAFHIPFEDYTAEELCGIAELIARDKGVKLSEKASLRLRQIFETARQSPDFGNGRYVRNAIEKAKLAQATRLVSEDIDKLTNDDLITIREEDIEIPCFNKTASKPAIGFAI